MHRILLWLMLAAWGLSAAPATAANNDTLVYEVRRGDTLIGLAQRYLTRESDYRLVQKANNVRDPHALPVGTKLQIARPLLKFQSSTARIVAVRGNVTVLRGGSSNAASTGATLSEGVVVRTGGSSFATLALENGSRISLPSNSDLKILRLRRYLIDSSLDYDFDVGRGGAKSKVAPLSNTNDRYIVRTPKAVSAVRGTDFQARYDEASGRDFSEVTEGGLQVHLPNGAATDLPAGNGLAVNADGGVISEALLPASEYSNAGKLQNAKIVRFELPKNNAVVGTRIALASDAGFVEQVAEGTFSSDAATFEAIDDGNYFVRFRSISANGIEGIPVTYGFKRRLNTVSASGGPGELGYVFKWLGEGRGTLRYHFQLYRNAPEGVPMVDEAGLAMQQISLSDLPAGDYYWRVASVQYLDGEVSTNWTPFEKLSVSAN